jgi:hypothetical protein
MSAGAGGGGGFGFGVAAGVVGAGFAVGGFRGVGAAFCPVGFCPAWPNTMGDEQSSATRTAAVVFFMMTPGLLSEAEVYTG